MIKGMKKYVIKAYVTYESTFVLDAMNMTDCLEKAQSEAEIVDDGPEVNFEIISIMEENGEEEE